MKLKFFYTMSVVIFLFVSCLPQKPTPVAVEQFGKEDALYLKAEQLLENKNYNEALATYGDYVNTYPDRYWAATALLKMGSIYSLLGNDKEAGETYRRLIREYPNSPFMDDAQYELISLLYREGKYDQVIEMGSQIQQKTQSRELLRKVCLIVGDTYIAKGSAMAAIPVFMIAMQNTDDLNKPSIRSKIKSAISALDTNRLQYLIGQPEFASIKNDLMYQLGMNYVKQNNYAAALKIFSDFVQVYPDYPEISKIENMMVSMYEQSTYEHHTIGCILPLSGLYKGIGEKALQGIELALDRYNSNSDVTPVKLIIKDSISDPKQAIQCVDELVNEKVAAIIGPIVTAQSAAIEAQSKGIPIITMTQKDHIPEIGDYVFRNFLTPKMQAKALVEFAIGTMNLSNFAILYPEENYGDTYMNIFWDEVIANGGQVVGVESYGVNQTDFADSIKKLVGLYYKIPDDVKQALEMMDTEGQSFENQTVDETNVSSQKEDKKDDKPEPIVDFDAIFIPDAPQKSGLIIPQLAFYDVNQVVMLGTNLWHSDKLIKMAGQYVQGAVLTEGFFPESKSDVVKSFKESFEQIFGQEPGFIEAIGYDTAMMLFDLTRHNEIQFRSSLKDAIKNIIGFEGVTGICSFDENGEAQKKIYLLQIKKNQFSEVDYP